ncbi:hypothetical protein BJF83_19725 [Nocardiopsis sp. CNR-923]|uniref:hypothetical protein n=1 Tax=Nocardiopsis sp. CNR-923 TaxID=1904965 RepID=UPI0009616F3C|nr:hypothetical protein [Nocardiopsis sp. CNR-923]OLT27010.1 hypothetical protein BJF83_19725 [Nocardiopsis sp. CNR-923]
MALVEEYAEAERDCANRINAGIPGRTRFAAMPGSGHLDPDVFYHGYEQDLSDLATAWGVEAATTDEHWWVDVGAAVGDWAVGAAEGLGAMVGAHSSEGWFQMSWGDALWENWESSAQSVASLVGMYDAESDDWGWSGWGAVGSAWRDAAHAVVPWEEWGERPGYVIGTAFLNIGVTAVGAALSATGVGAAVGVPLMAWRGAAVISRMGDSRVPDVGLPDTDAPGVSVNLNLPNFAGGSRELFRIDTSRFDLGGLSRERLAEAQGAVERLTARFGGGGAESADSPHHRRAVPEDPTTQDLADVVTVQDVLDPTSPEAARLRRQYEGDFLENDVRSDGAPGSWEAAQHSDTDGPEADGARVPAGVGGRGDDTLTASRNTPSPTANHRVDLTGIGDRGHDGDGSPDRDPDISNGRHDARLQDENSPARNHADGTDPSPSLAGGDTPLSESTQTREQPPTDPNSEPRTDDPHPPEGSVPLNGPESITESRWPSPADDHTDVSTSEDSPAMPGLQDVEPVSRRYSGVPLEPIPEPGRDPWISDDDWSPDLPEDSMTPEGRDPDPANTPVAGGGQERQGMLTPVDTDRGQIFEKIDRSRVTLDSNGRIRTIDDKPAGQYMAELLDLRVEQTKNQVLDKGAHATKGGLGKNGAITSLVLDRRTGIIVEGVNGRRDSTIPDELVHPVLQERLDALQAGGPYPLHQNGKPWRLAPTRMDDDPLRHAEVKAVNELLWRRGADADARRSRISSWTIASYTGGRGRTTGLHAARTVGTWSETPRTPRQDARPTQSRGCGTGLSTTTTRTRVCVPLQTGVHPLPLQVRRTGRAGHRREWMNRQRRAPTETGARPLLR